jgi:hypothetical protein
MFNRRTAIAHDRKIRELIEENKKKSQPLLKKMREAMDHPLILTDFRNGEIRKTTLAQASAAAELDGEQTKQFTSLFATVLDQKELIIEQ